MATVKNEWGVEIDFETAVELMDNDLRERLNCELAPCTRQEFFDAYAGRHYLEFGEDWELAKAAPVY